MLKTFTVQCDSPLIYRAEVTVEAEDLAGACRAALDAAGDEGDWKAPNLNTAQPTYVVAIAEGGDVDPWRLDHEGRDASVLPVPRLFSKVATIAGYAATRSEDLVDQLRIMVDAIGADGRLRVDPVAMARLCAAGKAILDDIERFGLGPAAKTTANTVGAEPVSI